jgi:hypothetical protein
MTIINANYYLEQLLAPAALEHIARLCKFCLRQRAITPAMLVPALLRAMGGDQVNDIAGLHRHFNALQLVNAHQVSYKPFHNQLRKESFALFMKALVERVIALRIDHQLKAASLGVFKQVLLHDGTSFAVHRRFLAGQDHQSCCYRVPYDHVFVGAEPAVHECVCLYDLGNNASSKSMASFITRSLFIESPSRLG